MGKITEKKEAAVAANANNELAQQQAATTTTTTTNETTDNKIAYCVKCKSKKAMQQTQKVKLKNGANALQGKCETCGTKVSRILGKDKTKPEK